MSLKEILQKIVTTNESILLADSSKDWEAGALLENLSGPKLETKAYIQPGLYIAEVNEGGYLGRVLYKIKQK
ncbi:hypothetical protein ACFLTH_03400 [Bacteroidota bacterium]